MANADIHIEIKKRILVLDGAMGTMIQSYNLNEKDFRGARFINHSCPLKGNNDLLSLTRAEIIYDIHSSYLEAGADIIETNTFNANRISMADYRLENLVYEMNVASAKIARSAADKYTMSQIPNPKSQIPNNNPDKPRFVAGSIGPTNKSASLSPDVNRPAFRAVTFDDLKNAYYEQAKGLFDGGVDILLVETIFDALNAKAALFAIEELFEHTEKRLPVMLSATISDTSGRILSGQTIEAFLISVSHIKPFSIGFNCAFGAGTILRYLEELSSKAPFYISAYPNAGLPDQFGKYKETPEYFTGRIKEFFVRGLVNIIGGCCGTTPEHIRAIAKVASEARPRIIPGIAPRTQFSGLEPLSVSKENNFINIGERTNVAGSRKFARLIYEKKYEEALSIARQQAEAGAQMLDVCLDAPMLNAETEIIVFLNLLASDPDIARPPVMLDSSKWTVIEAGLKCLQGKAIVNSISLKDGEESFLDRAKQIRRYGAAVVVMAFDEQGQAVTYERKIQVCKRAYDLLTGKIGFPTQDIIFDPNILTIGTGIEEHNNYAADFIKATRWIKENLPDVKISGGISNLSFAFRGNDVIREAMHSVFLFHAIQTGLDIAIVNAGELPVYDDIPEELKERVEDLILNRRPDATERLVEFAGSVKHKENAEEKKTEEWRNKSVEQRLSYAIIKGISDYIQADILDALKKFSTPVDIIEGPLMAGMNTVGELFSNGKMFLPQVIRSARVMKKAVSGLLPFIQDEKIKSGAGLSAGKILLATVKGDVHDIGKNIAGVVMACNNYEVIDLGVMVPAEKIIKAANDENVDIVGLSGLISPSLDEMAQVAKEMQKAGMNIPLLIGGATTSLLHTAIKIAPAYNAPVIHIKDASQSINALNSLMSKELRNEYIDKINNLHRQLRERHAESEKVIVTLEQARKNKFKISWSPEQLFKPDFTGIKIFSDYSLKEISKFIDWTPFFHVWKIKGIFPDLLAHPEKGEEAEKLFDDAKRLLDEIIKEKSLMANGAFGIFPANAGGDDVIVFDCESTKKETGRFYFLRNQELHPDGKPNLCLADFIAPVNSGLTDYIGLFAVTTGIGIEALISKYEQLNDNYMSIMVRALADRLADAFAELLHYVVRKKYWGYARNEYFDSQNFLKGKYQGIRTTHGYPACPDHSERKTLFNLLDAEKNTGITLTGNYAMYPAASVSGLYFAHPGSHYFGVGRIAEDQIKDYAQRKGKVATDVVCRS